MEPRRRTQRGRRTGFTAALLAVWALGTAPALAQLPVGPDVTVPPPIQHGTEHSSTTTTTTPPPTTTTAPPPPTTTPTTATPSRTQEPLGSSNLETSTPSGGGPATATATATEAGTDTARRSASGARRASSKSRTASGPVETFDVVPAAADDAPAIARLREVTLPAARQFGFPLGLAALVLAFLAVQGRLDARDPKLAAAPLSVDDDLLPFA